MRFACGIELRSALGAVLRSEIRIHGQPSAAGPAEHGGFAKSVSRPGHGRMIGQLFVAEMAGIVAIAADESDGDDVDRLVIVAAPRPVISAVDLDATHHARFQVLRHVVSTPSSLSLRRTESSVPDCAKASRGRGHRDRPSQDSRERRCEIADEQHSTSG